MFIGFFASFITVTDDISWRLLELSIAICFNFQLYPDMVRYELDIGGKKQTIHLEKNWWILFCFVIQKYQIFFNIFKCLKSL